MWWGRTNVFFVVHGHKVSLGYDDSQSFSLLVFRDYLDLALNHPPQTRRNMVFCPRFLLQSPQDHCGRLLKCAFSLLLFSNFDCHPQAPLWFLSPLALNFSFLWVSYCCLFPSWLSLPPALTWTAKSKSQQKCSEHVNQACKSLLV